MSSIPAKDVIYIDVDDEITTIIDKVRGSQSKILALVLPKRATTLQSVVNMKLLKRSADETSKNLVLITSEAGLLPLAANVGMYVAKNLQSKPEIPHVPSAVAELPDDFEESINMDDPDAKLVKPGLDKNAAVGDLARGSMPPSSLDDTINLDNDASDKNPIMRSIPTAGAGAVVGGPGQKGDKNEPKTPKGKKNKKLAIPNFDKFRMWLIIGGGGLVLIIFLWIMCFKVMPRATILVKTNSTAVDTNLNITLSTSTNSLSEDGGVVPAQSQQTQKTLTGQADASGQRNDGQKASGTVTMTAKACAPNLSQPAGVPAGAAVSVSGKTFITQGATTFSNSGTGSGSCITYQAKSSTNIVAQSAGAGSNVSSSSFAVAGRSDITASGETSGGTDQITKILQQSDIDAAKQKIASQDTGAIKQQLQNQLTNMGLYPVPATFTASTPNITTSANAGDEASNVTVTESLTYTMLGAKQADLKKLIAKAVDEQIDTKKQVIIDYGLDSAEFTIQNADNGNVAMHVTAVAGPSLKTETLRQQIAGKKLNDTKQIIKSNPGVTDVTVNYSPFWVSSTPSNTSKISITIDKPQTKANASN